MMHKEAATPELMEVLVRLMKVNELKDFRLVGGTALALQFGHRLSVDIELFAGGRIDVSKLPIIVQESFGDEFKLINKMQNGINGLIRNVKIDLIDWKVPFANDPIYLEGIRMATPHDIFAYKCEAIMDRKAEKDFCDIAMLMEHFDLSSLLETFRMRYPYISSGAIFPFLLKPEIIVRDKSIRLLNENSFEKYVEVVRRKLFDYEQQIQNKKKQGQEDRMNQLQALVEKKRLKDKNP
jgi:Nucleotidyl transferase AbiEii toxin, Type IV TA system